MKKQYVSPKAIQLAMAYEIVCSKKCHFADYQECSPSEQQFK